MDIKKITNYLFMIGVLFSTCACDKKEDKTLPIIKVGIISPLTSDVGSVAQDAREAAKYIASKYDNSHLKFKVIFEDDSAKTMRALSAAKKLAYVDNVDVLITHLSGSAQAVSPVATEANILHIGTVFDGQIKNQPTSMTLYSSPEKVSQKYIEFLKEKKVKKLAVLVLAIASTESIYNSLEVELKKENISFDKYTFIPGQRDYKEDLLKIKQKDYDMVNMLLYTPELEIVMKQYKEAGINIPVSNIETVNLSSKKELFEEVVFAYTSQGDLKAVKEVQNAINSKGSHAFNYIIDAFAIIHKISSDFYAQNRRIPNGTEMTQAILNMKNYDGVSGLLTINENRSITTPAVLMQIKNGKEVIIEK